jgi:4-hydroxy-3-methylbut-2-enyl diphosphate reductase IspH
VRHPLNHPLIRMNQGVIFVCAGFCKKLHRWTGEVHCFTVHTTCPLVNPIHQGDAVSGAYSKMSRR